MADAPSAKTPADFLKSIKGRPVIVKLNSGADYRGACACSARAAREMGAGQAAALLGLSCPLLRPLHASRGRCVSTGILACLDGYMNVAMEQTEVRKGRGQGRTPRRRCRGAASVLALTRSPACPQEYVNGQLKNKYGDAFIRGNNGASGCAEYTRTAAQSHAGGTHSQRAVLYISTAK